MENLDSESKNRKSANIIDPGGTGSQSPGPPTAGTTQAPGTPVNSGSKPTTASQTSFVNPASLHVKKSPTSRIPKLTKPAKVQVVTSKPATASPQVGRPATAPPPNRVSDAVKSEQNFPSLSSSGHNTRSKARAGQPPSRSSSLPAAEALQKVPPMVNPANLVMPPVQPVDKVIGAPKGQPEIGKPEFKTPSVPPGKYWKTGEARKAAAAAAAAAAASRASKTAASSSASASASTTTSTTSDSAAGGKAAGASQYSGYSEQEVNELLGIGDASGDGGDNKVLNDDDDDMTGTEDDADNNSQPSGRRKKQRKRGRRSRGPSSDRDSVTGGTAKPVSKVVVIDTADPAQSSSTGGQDSRTNDIEIDTELIEHISSTIVDQSHPSAAGKVDPTGTTANSSPYSSKSGGKDDLSSTSNSSRSGGKNASFSTSDPPNIPGGKDQKSSTSGKTTSNARGENGGGSNGEKLNDKFKPSYPEHCLFPKGKEQKEKRNPLMDGLAEQIWPSPADFDAYKRVSGSKAFTTRQELWALDQSGKLKSLWENFLQSRNLVALRAALVVIAKSQLEVAAAKTAKFAAKSSSNTKSSPAASAVQDGMSYSEKVASSDKSKKSSQQQQQQQQHEQKPHVAVAPCAYTLRVYQVDPANPEKRQLFTQETWEKLLMALFVHLRALKEYPNAPDTWSKNHGVFRPATSAAQQRMRHIVAMLEVEGKKFRAFSEQELEKPTVVVQACSYGKADFYFKTVGMDTVVEMMVENPSNGIGKLQPSSVTFLDSGILQLTQNGKNNAFQNIKVDRAAWNMLVANEGYIQVGHDSWRVYYDHTPIVAKKHFPEEKPTAAVAEGDAAVEAVAETDVSQQETLAASASTAAGGASPPTTSPMEVTTADPPVQSNEREEEMDATEVELPPSDSSAVHSRAASEADGPTVPLPKPTHPTESGGGPTQPQ